MYSYNHSDLPASLTKSLAFSHSLSHSGLISWRSALSRFTSFSMSTLMSTTDFCCTRGRPVPLPSVITVPVASFLSGPSLSENSAKSFVYQHRAVRSEKTLTCIDLMALLSSTLFSMKSPFSCLSFPLQACTLTSSQSIPPSRSVPDMGDGVMDLGEGGGGDIQVEKRSDICSAVRGRPSFGVIDRGMRKWAVGKNGAGFM